MATAKTDGFRWLPSYYEAIRDLPDLDRLAMYDAICDYGFGNEVNELPQLLKALFRLIEPTLEKSVKFEAKQKANGQKGGRPQKPKETQIEPKETQTNFGENLDVAIDVAIDVDLESAVEKADKPPRAPRFTPPAVEEIRKYVSENKYHVDAQRFHDFYCANGWVQGKGKPIRDWKAAIRTWERRDNDGHDSNSSSHSEKQFNVKYDLC